MHHPADGPRLKTLYVTESTRRRRRRTNSKRRRRNAVLGVLGLIVAIVAGVMFRDRIGKRLAKLTKQSPPPHMVRDVTAPTQQIAPGVAKPPATVSHSAPAAATP